ncbi:uncharacterized protein LOC143285941 [Babylonia areolata]|uniref:uncharacterized protein LOC143285941 n=1 Tax=Babylonia areolata TaxID=304850 RepID=UPI003FD34F7D
MDIVYTVLYTHQKRKKAKTWQDGTLKVLATGTKAVLYDDKGSKLDVVHIHASDVITGEQLESDRYYIQVEEIQKKSTPQTADTQASSAQYPQNSCPMAQPKAAQSQPLKAVTTQNAGPSNEGSGLKRKRSGFIPPRVVRPRTAENDAPCLDNIQPKVSSAFTPHNGSSSHLFGTVSSLPSDNSSEKLSPSALFSAGRTRNGASVDTPPDFFKTSDSPQSRPQASLLTKSSPWRTIGSGLSKTSPVGHHLSPGQTVTVEGKEQSVSRDAQSPWNRDKPGATSVLPSLSPSQESFNKTTEASKSLLGNRVQLGLNAPLGKRSASEIMALLGKKKHEVAVMRTANTCSNSEKSSALQNFGTVAQIADQEPRSVVSNESGLSCTSDTTRVEEMEFQNTFTNENDHNKDRLQKSSPNIYNLPSEEESDILEGTLDPTTKQIEDLESGDGMDVLVSSPLPHPDRLVRNSVAEVTTHGNCSTTTTSNIAEAISARLTGYKMQGMVASGMVQRPMAYRREIDHRQPLPWISTPSAGPYNSRYD